MLNTAFAFGENDTFLLECPSRRVYNNLPPAILDTLSNGDISQIGNLTFGPTNSFMISFDQPRNRGYRVQTEALPQPLSNWLGAKDSNNKFQRSFSTLQVSLGAKPGVYWAADGISCAWKGIPQQLDQKLQSYKKNGGGWTMKPEIVSLGMGEDYVMLAKGGGSVEIAWNLDNYPNLEKTIEKVLDKKLFDGVKNIAISPFKKNAYAILVNDILIHNGTPNKTKEAVGRFAEDIKTDGALERRSKSQAAHNSVQAAIRRSEQQIWDMEHNSDGLTRQVCKSCTRPRGLCDCDVADYQTEYPI